MTIRLLYLAPDPALTLDQQGGAGTHMRGTIGPLRAQGLEIQVAVGSAAGLANQSTIAQRPAPRLRRAAPEPIRLLGRDLRLLAHGRALRRAAYADFDCVYERSAYLLDVGRELALRRDKPYVVETDGILVEARRSSYGVALGRWGERIERSKIRSAALVVVMSQASRDDIAMRFGLPDDRLLVKGLGIDRKLIDRQPNTAPSIDVGWAGTFQTYHGVELLMNALQRMPGRSALLIGDGPGRAAIERGRSGLPVEFAGLLSRDAALHRLEECRVLVIPESSESVYPVKFLEYAALRRPVVCPRRRAFDEFRSDGTELVFRFEPGDPDDLARAIEEAVRARDDRVERLHELVTTSYTWDAAAERLGQRLRQLVSAP
jgi:glycosyltransferase involved in cell wall biosynthesis